MPTLYVIAGPNRCGKSTLTRMSGFSGIDIIDPDVIARGLGSGKHVHARGRHCVGGMLLVPGEIIWWRPL